MPTTNTKVLTARIDKGKYYWLLERASARRIALSAYVNVLLDELMATKKEVVQKAEKGAYIEKPIDVLIFAPIERVGYPPEYFVATKDGIDGRYQMRRVIRMEGNDFEFSPPLKEHKREGSSDRRWLDCHIVCDTEDKWMFEWRMGYYRPLSYQTKKLVIEN